MFIIESKFGNDGYAAWFKILETLAKTDNHWIDLQDEANLMFLSAKCRIAEGVLLELIEAVVKLGEIDSQLWHEQKVIWCQKFVDSIEDAYRKRNNECVTKASLIAILGGLGRNIKPLGHSEGGVNPQSKEEESKEEQTKSLDPLSKDEKLETEFDLFWKAYGSERGLVPCQREWSTIDHAEYPKIIEHAPRFVKASGSYQKLPINYLKERCWQDKQLPNYADKSKAKNTTVLVVPTDGYGKNSWDE